MVNRPSRSPGELTAQVFQRHATAVVVGLGLTVGGHTPCHLKFLKRFEIGYPHYDSGELAVAGDADASPPYFARPSTSDSCPRSSRVVTSPEMVSMQS